MNRNYHNSRKEVDGTKRDRSKFVHKRSKKRMLFTVLRSEKARWQEEARKYKLRLGQYIRMVINSRLHISTEDLVRKVERPQPEQMSML